MNIDTFVHALSEIDNVTYDGNVIRMSDGTTITVYDDNDVVVSREEMDNHVNTWLSPIKFTIPNTITPNEFVFLVVSARHLLTANERHAIETLSEYNRFNREWTNVFHKLGFTDMDIKTYPYAVKVEKNVSGDTWSEEVEISVSRTVAGGHINAEWHRSANGVKTYFRSYTPYASAEFIHQFVAHVRNELGGRV